MPTNALFASQHEARQQGEHQDRDDHGACPGVDLAGDAPFHVVELAVEGVELARPIVGRLLVHR